jgi:hypothetical protein
MCSRPRRTTLRSGLSGRIGLHPQHVGPLHRADQIDDGERIGAVVFGEVRQDPERAQPFGDRTSDDAAIVEILIEKRAQRMAGAFHVANDREDRLTLGGQCHAVRQPVEQAQPELGFETLDPAHDGRGAVPRGGRGLAEAQSESGRHEQLQIVPRDSIDQGPADGLLYFCNRPLRILGHSTVPVPA